MKHKLMMSTLLLVALFLTLAPTTMASTTWYVNGVSGSNTNSCKLPTAACKTIGHTISLASSGDSIMVAAATYAENLTISKSLKIIGSGASTTIVDGGGKATVVAIPNTSTSVILSSMTIRNGQAVDGGGVYNSGNLIITSTTMSGNSAVGTPTSSGPTGGGIYNIGTLTIYNSTVSGNVAAPGPKCYPIINSDVSICHSNGSGGGIYNGGKLAINKSTVSGNLAQKVCFLVFNRGIFLLCHGGDGGGIESPGTLTISNSTVSGNVATPATGCSFIGCFSSGFGGGGDSGGTLTISNSTISGNSAYQGGGIDGSATLQNSIVANNPGGNCSGPPISNGYNMSSDDTCKFGNSGDRNSTDPILGPLQNNKGPTQTMALLPGSPAIDAGNPSGCTDGQGHLLKTDQRGQPRPDSEDKTGCDMW